MRLSDRVALVTGGGRGIGAAVARSLASEGARMAVASRTLTEIDEVASELTRTGSQAVAVQCDVGRPEEIASAVAHVSEELGRVDILINNAGIASSASLSSQSLQEWERIFRVNVTGTFLCTQACLPGMLERGWGRVVNVASVAALGGAKYISAYSASKHAVLGFTRCVALEAASRGVTVNSVCPGYVDTDLTRASVARIMEKTGMNEGQAVQVLCKTNPQNRLLTSEEVAHAVLVLCLPESAGINGQALVLDGGGFVG